jgi:hypothetical protein
LEVSIHNKPSGVLMRKPSAGSHCVGDFFGRHGFEHPKKFGGITGRVIDPFSQLKKIFANSPVAVREGVNLLEGKIKLPLASCLSCASLNLP